MRKNPNEEQLAQALATTLIDEPEKRKRGLA
jgi:hypothetical protein